MMFWLWNSVVTLLGNENTQKLSFNIIMVIQGGDMKVIVQDSAWPDGHFKLWGGHTDQAREGSHLV